MSLRVIRKLRPEDNCVKDCGEEKSQESLSESGAENNESQKSNSKSKKPAMNRFELLSLANSFSDTEAKEDDDNESSNKTCNDVETEKSRLEKQMSTESLKKKKKKKKKLRHQKSTENELNSPANDEIEASVNEVNKILGNYDTIEQKSEDVEAEANSSTNFFYVEHRNLNPDNELKRIFGSRTVASEQALSNRRKARGRITGHRSWILANPKNSQNIGKPPISMQLVKTVGEDKNAELHFNFVHSKTYQTIQFQFFTAVESYNPENLVALLNAYPYHIDTLIQFSDVCRMGEDVQMAAELIERALLSFETILHPSFNVTHGNCRLDFRVPENRSFFIALFKHILFIGQRGCNRTALEFCKLLLGLDPNGDPLCVLQMIDFYAIRSGQFDYLLELYECWSNSKKLWLFPNFRYSVALTYFLKSQSSPENESFLNEADKQLKDALLLFPNVLLPLLDRCSVEPDSEVLKYPCFARSKHISQSLQHLSSIFIGRNYMQWKEKETMAWLERNVREIVVNYKANDPSILEAEEKRKQYFSQATPRNVLRHIILSGIKEVTATLTPDLTSAPVFAFDPFPPIDSVATYTRPQSSRPPAQQGNENIFSLFLRSWLPDFNPETGATNQGAVGGHPVNVERRGNGAQREHRETNDLRRSVTSLLDAMRDLLSNIDMADIPNEGDAEESEDDARNR